MAIFLFFVGLALLLLGGKMLVSAAVEAAFRLRVPPLLVGLTLVAWGTSLPELAFNLTASWQGKTDLVLGNVVGANICNLGLVLGVSALIARLVLDSTVVRREIPVMLVLFGLMLGAAVLPWFAEALGGRLRPGLLLAGFAIYSFVAIRQGLARRETDVLAEQTATSAGAPSRPIWLLGVLFVGGIALLGVGGSLASDSASAIARALGMSDRVVGLTVVALGTTMPELITGILAVRQKQVDLAVGNAVGSCLFNVGAIYAISRLIAPASVPENALPSLVVMILLGTMLVPLAWSLGGGGRGGLGRRAGLVLLLTQGLFIAWEVWRTRV